MGEWVSAIELLHFAFMNLADATWNNKLVLLTDLVYSDLRGHHATPEDLLFSIARTRNYFFSLRRAVTGCWTTARRLWTCSAAFVTGI